jgi:phenylalanyl-tRNA synthetase alpha chain
MPGTPLLPLGSRHPTSLTKDRLMAILANFGFVEAEGPEIETDYYNFTALNVAPWHPARAMHDTFYLPGGYLLRTHTSSVQIRTMEVQGAPLRIMTPGRVYRCDSDQTHTPMFHQLEGLVVDEHCSFAEMITVLKAMLSQFFGREVETRLRPSYFPFTAPSYELDIRWEGHRWLEVLGCGMVHPHILDRLQIDRDRYRGYAFGLGLDRFAMLQYGINDLRLMFENRTEFLAQF